MRFPNFTTTVECPRVTFEYGSPIECEGDIQIEGEWDGDYVAETRVCPAEEPHPVLLSMTPTHCTHGSVPQELTAVERAELERRMHVAMWLQEVPV